MMENLAETSLSGEDECFSVSSASGSKGDIIQGRNIRFNCELFDWVEYVQEELCQEALCYQVEAATIKWCQKGVQKIVFSRKEKQIEGLLKLTNGVHKKSGSKDQFFFLLDIPESEVAARGVLAFKQTEWPRSKTPFKNFLRHYKPNFKKTWRKISTEEGENKWYSEPISYDPHEESSLLDMILSSQNLCSDEQELKEFLLDNYDKAKLLSHGGSIMRNIALFVAKDTPEFLSKEKGCFPVWSEKRIQELEHCDEDYYSSECATCREHQALIILKWWHSNIFLSKRKDESCLQEEDESLFFFASDLSLIKRKYHRLKGLIIRSDREAGKTSWFQAICQGDLARIVHFKNKFNASEAEKLKLGAEKIWLILVDDFSTFTPTDLQALKALLVGEPTTVLGKWLSYNYKGGVPCVVLCNSTIQFKALYDDPEIQSQCKFIDLPPAAYLGPPGTGHSKLVTTFSLLQNAI